MCLLDGLAFSPDGRLLSPVDSFAGVVRVRDYDPEGTGVGERRAFLDASAMVGLPDGLAVDF